MSKTPKVSVGSANAILPTSINVAGSGGPGSPMIHNGPLSTKIRLVYYGDSPSASTGFGTVAKNILIPLYKTGNYDISVLGVNYWGDPHPFPFRIWPMAGGLGADHRDPFGRGKAKNLLLDSNGLKYDVFFNLQDTFILEPFLPEFVAAARATGRKFKTVYYFPIDGTPKASWMKPVLSADAPVTYTNFGYNECIKVHPELADKLKIIPHGANIKDFYPLPPEAVRAWKSQYFKGKEDCFMLLNVNRNQQRKDLPRTIAAFRKVKDAIPNAMLYMHCAIQDQGWRMDEVCKAYGFDLRAPNPDIVMPVNIHPGVGVPIQLLNNIYNAADMVVSTTLGEGWGLSATEAMAVKKCCVFPDNTSLTEIFADGRGALVKSGDTASNWTVIVNDNEIPRPLTNVDDMANTIISLYKNPILRENIAQKAYDFVTNNWQWDKHIAPQWDRIFKEQYNQLGKETTTQAGSINGVVL